MELIPLLRRMGYRYAIVDSEHVEPVGDMRWEDIRYRPHVARHDGHEIVVVVRDRELSDAQESGMEYGWFRREVEARTRHCQTPPLVTTCTDGDNGGWFRNTTVGANFWTAFYGQLADDARRGGPVRPAFIDDYLREFGVHGEVRVNTGAWNTGWHHGVGFVQWTGSQAQKDALARVADVSRAVHEAMVRAADRHSQDPELRDQLENAMWRLLRAETSCNFFWGEAWVDRCHRDLDASWTHVERVRLLLER
jgi:alpha-amylase/alpha-mannosidase (GH57 family)